MNRILEKLLVNLHLISWARWVGTETPQGVSGAVKVEEVSLGACYCGLEIFPKKIQKLYVLERDQPEPEGGLVFVDVSGIRCQVGCIFCHCERTRHPLDRHVVLDEKGRVLSLALPC